MTMTKGAPTPTPTPTGTSDPLAGLTPAQKQLVQQYMNQPGTTGTAAGQVYMGTKPTKVTQQDLAHLPPSDRPFITKGTPAPNWMSQSDAENQYFTWNAKKRQDFIAQGLLSGLLTAGAGDLEGSALWKQLVDQAANYGANGAKVTPFDLLASYVKSNSTGGWIKSGDFETNPATGQKRYIGPRFKTTTQTSVDLTDPATARAIATSVFQDLLGRDPGQGEINAYASALASSEAQNPSTATTTTQYDPTTGEATSQSTVNSGGLTDQGRQLLAEDEIKKGKEFGATQAATTYENALKQAVGL